VLRKEKENTVDNKKVERVEDLIAWQKARALTKEIYQITNTGDFARDFRTQHSALST
jgi:hypothetical protein